VVITGRPGRRLRVGLKLIGSARVFGKYVEKVNGLANRRISSGGRREIWGWSEEASSMDFAN